MLLLDRKNAKRDLNNICLGLAIKFGSLGVLWNLSFAWELVNSLEEYEQYIRWGTTLVQVYTPFFFFFLLPMVNINR